MNSSIAIQHIISSNEKHIKESVVTTEILKQVRASPLRDCKMFLYSLDDQEINYCWDCSRGHNLYGCKVCSDQYARDDKVLFKLRCSIDKDPSTILSEYKDKFYVSKSFTGHAISVSKYYESKPQIVLNVPTKDTIELFQVYKKIKPSMTSIRMPTLEIALVQFPELTM